jgi:hypothetical protein
MNMNPEFEKKIEDALNSLDGIQRAEPRPFFYTRVIGRLQKEERTIWETMGSFISRPAVVIAGLCVILVMNAFILVNQDNTATNPSQAASEQINTDNDYILASSSSFDYANIDPQ